MTADPKGTHEAVEAPIPRQRDAGVMGYVAELQQFDDSMTGGESAEGDSPDAAPPSRTPALNRPPALDRPVARGRASIVDRAEPPSPGGAGVRPGGEGPPRTGAALRVPGKEGRPPWTRTEVGLAVAFVLVAAVAIVGGAYAVLVASRPPTGQVPLPLPTVEAAAGDEGAQGSGEPTPAGSPSGEPTPGAAPGAVDRPSTGGGSVPGGTTAPPPPEASSAPPAAPDLVARYSREANTGLLGLTGYRGKVTISNRGKGTASGWEVTLSLPAGQKVDSVEGAEARQEGELVTFTPVAGSGAVAPDGSVAFTFEVPGLLADEPTGCAINGRPCE